MRRYLASLVGLALLLFALGAMAQTSRSSGRQATTTTTTTTTEKTSVSGTEHTIEGCLMKEANDFFLIPARGNPIELQPSAGQDLSAHEGHKVKISGVESSLSASGGAGNTGGTAGTVTSSASMSSASGTHASSSAVTEPAGHNQPSKAGEASGTGNDLHHLATMQMAVTDLTHVAESCPVNWNPRVSGKKGSSKY